MKHSLIGLLTCLIPVLLPLGCEKNPVRARLADIESYAQSNPDSARRALEAIDPSFLNTRRLQAQHALMLSTALSRCKVKVPNDSLINIAVDYYDHFGPQKEKFLSYYYRGRVYEDLGNYEAAIENYVEAESISPKDDISFRYLTSLQLKKGMIYRRYYDYDKAIESYRKAQSLAQRCDWQTNYFGALIGELTVHVIFEKMTEADSLIDVIRPFREEMTVLNRMAFDNDVLLSISLKQSKNDSILVRAHAFEQDYSSREDFPWGSLSIYYSEAGDYANSKRALDRYSASHGELDSDKVYLLASSVMNDSLGVSNTRLGDVSTLNHILFDELYEKSGSNLRFVEERKIREKRNLQLKRILMTGSVIAFLLGVLFFVALRRRRKQKEELSQKLFSLKNEYEEMSALLQNNSSIQDEARSLLGQRVKSLAQFLSVDPPSSLDKVADQLDSLTENRKELLETIGLLYAVYHPAFVNRLQACGLSNGEIGYCCLLVLGFRTGEIGDVINRSSTYHISSTIRQKVGLGPNDTNLSIFLKNLFKETGS